MRKLLLAPGYLTIVAALACGSCPTMSDELPPRQLVPSAQQPGGPPPGRIIQQHLGPPALNVEGEKARANALEFIGWAAAAPKSEDETVRKILADTRGNQTVIRSFCEEAFRTQAIDHSRALIALSLLGEMRSETGAECLQRFVDQALPEKGTEVDGEILERSALETLQAKAIEGIAYLRTARSDELVLETITKHPSRVVRAQAIAAFLFNHSYSPDALELAIKAARPDERIFVDRVVRREGEAAQDFNPKLDAFLKAHPEANPPAPTQREVDRTPQSPLPPDFYNRRR